MGSVTTNSFMNYSFNSTTGVFTSSSSAVPVLGTYDEISPSANNTLDNTFEDNEVFILDGGPTEVRYLGSFTNADGTFLHFQYVTGGLAGSYYLDSFDVKPSSAFPSSFSVTDGNYSDANLAFCFLEGTLIRTPDGEVAVESLAIGDSILTAEDGRTQVMWIGRQTILPRFASARLLPVRISAGALGDGLPETDLTVTADHGMMLDGLVVNAGALINGTTIIAVPADALPDRVTFYHVETEHHEVILANGASAESFIDYAGRQAFDNYDEYLALYGADRILREMPAPRISTPRLLPPHLRQRLGIVHRAA